jgi:cytochrome o ubiquinol oxidase operon protein cyoD
MDQHDDKTLSEVQKMWHGTYLAYVIGFLGSVILTALAFYLVWAETLQGGPLIITIVALAIVQAIVQLIFFLHLGNEPKPRWETLIFSFMVLVLLIIALGTLWIMYDLNNRVMTGM